MAPEGSRPLGSYRLIDRKYDQLENKLTQSQRIKRFKQYLTNTKGQQFSLNGVALDRSGDTVDINVTIPYVHRWTDVYRKKTLAKLYLLEAWWNCHKTPLCMLTLTTYQDGAHSVKVKGRKVSREESFEILKYNWNKLLQVLRYYLGNFQYIVIVEPHKSGYPHQHVLLFVDIPEALQNRIRSLWSEKYGAASKEHGVDFKVDPLSGITSVKNYLMKYLHKSFEYEDNRNYTLFNTIVWENGYRVFTSSRLLSRVMDRYQEDRGVYWIDTDLLGSDGVSRTVWTNPLVVQQRVDAIMAMSDGRTDEPTWIERELRNEKLAVDGVRVYEYTGGET